MTKKLLTLFAALAIAASLHAAAAASSPPAKNWVLPLFSKEGHRTLTARGSEARLISEQQFDVTDLNLTVFSTTVANQVETIILSPAASFLVDDKIARGDRSVRFLNDNLEATGTRWVYDHGRKKVSLDGQVRIVINAQLSSILK